MKKIVIIVLVLGIFLSCSPYLSSFNQPVHTGIVKKLNYNADNGKDVVEFEDGKVYSLDYIFYYEDGSAVQRGDVRLIGENCTLYWNGSLSALLAPSTLDFSEITLGR